MVYNHRIGKHYTRGTMRDTLTLLFRKMGYTSKKSSPFSRFRNSRRVARNLRKLEAA